MILDAPVSIFQGSFNTTPQESIPLTAVLRQIQDGTHQTATEYLRHLHGSGDRAIYTTAKEKSLAFTPCCNLTSRDKDIPWPQKLIGCTGLVHLDLDELDDPEAMKLELAQHPSVAFIFVSPSNRGLKVGVAATGIDAPETYKRAWTIVVDAIRHAYPAVHVNVDNHVKFLHALCYMSHDPALYVNDHAVPFAVPPPGAKPSPSARLTDDAPDYARVMQALYCIPNHDADYDVWLTLGMSLHSCGESWARDVWDNWSRQSAKFDENKQEKSWRSFAADGQITIATLFGQAKEHGWTPPKARMQAQTQRAIPDMTGTTPAQDAHQRQNGHSSTSYTWGTAVPAAVTPHPVIIAMDEVEKRPVEWLWWPYIAVGKVALLDGDPGTGKTLLAIQLAANLSRGFPLPDQQGKPTMPSGDPAPTVFIATEDDLADTMKDRLEKAGADCTQIKVFNEFVDEEGQTRPFTLNDMPFLEQCLETVKPRLVVIDAIQAVLGGKVDINRANQVTELLRHLSNVAARFHCAIVCIRHPSKPGQNIAKLIHRGMGSQAFIGSARLGLFVEEHPCDVNKVFVVQSKSNAGDRARTQIFSKRGGQFEWCGVTRVNKEMMAGGGKGPTPQMFLEAVFWLEERLQDGRSYPAKDIQEEMKEDGFTHGLMFNAKKALGVIHKKTPAGTFTWYLPPLSVVTPSTSSISSTSSTSSTSYSSKKTTIYEDTEDAQTSPMVGQVDLSQVSDVDDVVDVYDVDAVVTGEDSPIGSVPFVPSVASENGTNVPAATEDAPPLRVGDLVVRLAAGVILDKDPIQIAAIELGSDGQAYARYGEYGKGWLLANCERVPEPPSREPGEDAVDVPEPGPSEGVSAMVTACPQCRCTSLFELGDYRKCPLCNWKGPAVRTDPSSVSGR